jgi:hypothetical protein
LVSGNMQAESEAVVKPAVVAVTPEVVPAAEPAPAVVPVAVPAVEQLKAVDGAAVEVRACAARCSLADRCH